MDFLLEKAHEALRYLGIVSNKPPKEIGFPLQTLKLMNSAHGRQLKYCLYLQWINHDPMLGNDETQQPTGDDTETAFQRVQPDFVLSTAVRNSSQVSRMIGPFLGVGSEIVKISFHELSNIMESVTHHPLESRSNIFKGKGHFLIGEGAPRANKSGLMLIFWLDLDLIVAEESIHKGEDFISRTIIQDLINERRRIIVLGIGLVQISKISTDTNLAILLIHCN